jgi:cobalt-zinc-cadmium efflux system outer membrane protein
LDILTHYRNDIIPLRASILATSEELYNVMGLGIERLLDNKRLELQMSVNYATALRNYWLARVQMDRALGGKLYVVLKKMQCEKVVE